MGRAILAFSQNLFGCLANSMQTVDCEHQDGCTHHALVVVFLITLNKQTSEHFTKQILCVCVWGGGGGGGWRGRGVSFSRGQFSFGSVFQALVFKGAVGGEWEYIFLITPVAIYAW